MLSEIKDLILRHIDSLAHFVCVFFRMRNKDKMDRATVEQVMDPRTRMILFKLLRRQLISEINGCVSTGKEANVYHAKTPTGEDRAIKVNCF